MEGSNKHKIDPKLKSQTQIWLKGIGSGVRGTQDSFNVNGEHSKISAEQAIINAGLGAGNPNMPASQSALAGGGCDNAFNAEQGAIILTGATVNAGAFSGGGGSRNVGYGDAPGSHTNKYFDDKGKSLRLDDPAQLEAVRARFLAKHKNLATASPAETFLVTESNALVTNVPAGSSRKSSLGSNGSASSAKEIVFPSDENSLSKKKIELGSWSEPLPAEPPAEVTFDSESLDSLWYRNMDYTPFLCDRMVFPSDLERNKALILNQSASKFLRLTVAQLARSVSSSISVIDAVNDLEKEVQDLTKRVAELEKERDDYKHGKEKADFLVDTYLTQEKNWKKMLGEKDAELHLLKSQAQNFEEVLQKKVAETEELSYPMFRLGFDEAVKQMKHFNPDVTLDVDRLNRDVSLNTMIEREEA